jgi:hypothetical protein
MHMLSSYTATFAVILIYYIWRTYLKVCWRQQQQQLRERVAYMLWMVAQRMDGDPRKTVDGPSFVA